MIEMQIFLRSSRSGDLARHILSGDGRLFPLPIREPHETTRIPAGPSTLWRSHSAAPSCTCASNQLISQERRPPEEYVRPVGIGVISIGRIGGEVLSALSGKLLYLKRSIAIDADPVTLLRVTADEKLMFRPGDPHSASQFPKDFRADFAELLEGIDIVFIVTGGDNEKSFNPWSSMADVLRERSITTITAVIPSIGLEGANRIESRHDDIQTLKDASNAVFRLAITSLRDPTSTLTQAIDAFEHLYHGVAKPVFDPGFVSLEAETVVHILSQKGASAIGFGTASGEDAIETATLCAITHPLLGRGRLYSASTVFFHLEGPSDFLTMKTINKVMNIVRRVMDEYRESLLVCGATESKALSRNCRITIFATGINML